MKIIDWILGRSRLVKNMSILKKYMELNEIKLVLNDMRFEATCYNFENKMINIMSTKYISKQQVQVMILHELGHSLQSIRDLKNYMLSVNSIRQYNIYCGEEDVLYNKVRRRRVYDIEVSAWENAIALKDELGLDINDALFNKIRKWSIKSYSYFG